MIFESRNPATEEVLETFEGLSDQALEEVLARSEKATVSWRDTPIEDRAGILRNVAKLLRQRQLSLAELATEEMGKLTREAIGEVEKCALACDYYADNAAAMLADETIESNAHHSFVSCEPLKYVIDYERVN